MEGNVLSSGLQPGHARHVVTYLARGPAASGAEHPQRRRPAGAHRQAPGLRPAQQQQQQQQQQQPRTAVVLAAAAAASASAAPSLDAAPRTESPLHRMDLFDDIPLAKYDPASSADPTQRVDVVIVGAGPSGLAVADRVSAAGFRVVIVDPNPTAPWINNYGVWIDEFEAMGLDHCFDYIWPKAVVRLDAGDAGARCGGGGRRRWGGRRGRGDGGGGASHTPLSR